jgi:hypothetical protein
MKWIKVSILPAAVVAVALAAFIGFGGGQTSPVEAEDTLSEVPEVMLTPEEAEDVQAALVEAAPADQAAALADDTVTFSEYTAAVDQSKKCVTDAIAAAAAANGVELDVQSSPNQVTDDEFQIDYTFEVRIAKEDIRAVVANPDLDVSAYEPACQARDLTQIEDFYQAELRSSEAYVDESVQRLADCIGVTGSPDQFDADNAVDVVAAASAAAKTDQAAKECLAESPSLTQLIEAPSN